MVKVWLITAGMFALIAGSASGLDPDAKCEAKKLSVGGKYGFCLLKAEAKAIKTGAPVDYAKCDQKFGKKWAAAESAAGTGVCPTEGDQSELAAVVTAHAARVALQVSGVRFVDNGDGTLTDVETGLMWERKTDDAGVHDKDNLYTWTAGPSGPNGTVFTSFLATLNGSTSSDGVSQSGCFVGHCDWRLPTIDELRSILREPFPCAGPCIDSIFGPTFPSYHWSITADSSSSSLIWGVSFNNGFVLDLFDEDQYHARAVRTVW